MIQYFKQILRLDHWHNKQERLKFQIHITVQQKYRVIKLCSILSRVNLQDEVRHRPGALGRRCKTCNASTRSNQHTQHTPKTVGLIKSKKTTYPARTFLILLVNVSSIILLFISRRIIIYHAWGKGAVPLLLSRFQTLNATIFYREHSCFLGVFGFSTKIICRVSRFDH